MLVVRVLGHALWPLQCTSNLSTLMVKVLAGLVRTVHRTLTMFWWLAHFTNTGKPLKGIWMTTPGCGVIGAHNVTLCNGEWSTWTTSCPIHASWLIQRRLRLWNHLLRWFISLPCDRFWTCILLTQVCPKLFRSCSASLCPNKERWSLCFDAVVPSNTRPCKADADRGTWEGVDSALMPQVWVWGLCFPRSKRMVRDRLHLQVGHYNVLRRTTVSQRWKPSE